VERSLYKGFRLTLTERMDAISSHVEKTFQEILRSELRRVTRSDSTAT